MDVEYYKDEFRKERRARLAAERLLEQKQSQLKAANQKLSQHALNLSGQIVDQRKVLDKLKDENSEVAAQNLKANHKALAAERLLWDAVKSIQDGFALFDKDRRLISANSAYLGLFRSAQNIGPGISLESILDLCLEDDLIERDGKTADEWYDFMLDRLTKEPIKPVTLKLHNGIYIKLVDRRTSDGGIVSLALNITDTIRREEELLQARDKAQAADRAKSAFLAKMSHEFRTPINGIVGMADLLLERATDEDGLLYAETIKTSGQSLLDFVSNVLEYATLEAGNITPNPNPFAIGELLEDLKGSVPNINRPKGVEIVFETDANIPSELIGDAKRIGRVLSKLYSNALENTASGSVMVRTLWNADAEPGLMIAIEDTGKGISEDKLGHIFAGFNQVDDSFTRENDGAGLGLSIAHKLIGALGGKLTVQSIEGEGSHFEVSIPVSFTEQPDQPQNTPIGTKSALLIAKSPLTRASVARSLRMKRINFEESACVPAEPLKGAEFAFVDQDLTPDIARLMPGIPIIALGPPDGFDAPYRGSDLETLLAQSSPAKPQDMTDGTFKVLAAEDNKTNQLVFQKMLKGIDIELTLVANGLEAVEARKTIKPHLIFMDISMPKMDGMEATQQIRWYEVENGEDPTPIVAMTAHASEDDEARIRNCGLDHYMTKPLNKAAIIEIIENTARGRGISAPLQDVS